MSKRVDEDWLQGRASLGAASGWKAEEMRIVADLGYALAEQGRNDEAITIFEGLAALAPATVYFQSALGALRLRRGEVEQALAHLDAVIAADPRNIAALTNRGEARLRLGQHGGALEDLRAALSVAAGAPQSTETIDSAARARALMARLGGEASSTALARNH